MAELVVLRQATVVAQVAPRQAMLVEPVVPPLVMAEGVEPVVPLLGTVVELVAPPQDIEVVEGQVDLPRATVEGQVGLLPATAVAVPVVPQQVMVGALLPVVPRPTVRVAMAPVAQPTIP